MMKINGEESRMRAIVTAILLQACQKLYGTKSAFSHLSESSIKADALVGIEVFLWSMENTALGDQ